jgi:flavin reductase (DIM6/NTAB) family NADH-FMN oxidoreductase RutF
MQMSESRNDTKDRDHLGAALGRVPSGLFIVTARLDDRSTGMLASWVQQVGFEPPMICLSVKKGRFLTSWLERHPCFALNQLGRDQKDLLRHFAAGFEPEADAFSGVRTVESDQHGTIVLKDAIAWMECRLAHVFATGGDHELIVAHVVAGKVQDKDAEPAVHLRKSGFHY